jgi:hypothetical protein
MTNSYELYTKLVPYLAVEPIRYPETYTEVSKHNRTCIGLNPPHTFAYLMKMVWNPILTTKQRRPTYPEFCELYELLSMDI